MMYKQMSKKLEISKPERIDAHNTNNIQIKIHEFALYFAFKAVENRFKKNRDQ